MSEPNRPLRVEVDGEVIEIVAHGRLGQYHYAWVSGPNPGYGSGSASSERSPSTMTDHEEAIRDFPSQIDPETGFIG